MLSCLRDGGSRGPACAQPRFTAPAHILPHAAAPALTVPTLACPADPSSSRRQTF